MFDDDHTVDAAACFPICCDLHVDRVAACNEIIEDLVGHSFVEDATIAEVEVLVLQRLEFNAYIVRDVLNGHCPEVGQARLWTDRCVLWVDVSDREPTSWTRIRECFKLHGAKLRRERTPAAGRCALSWFVVCENADLVHGDGHREHHECTLGNAKLGELECVLDLTAGTGWE